MDNQNDNHNQDTFRNYISKYFSCETCKQFDKLIHLYQFDLSHQENEIHAKAIHLISKHGFQI